MCFLRLAEGADCCRPFTGPRSIGHFIPSDTSSCQGRSLKTRASRRGTFFFFFLIVSSVTRDVESSSK